MFAQHHDDIGHGHGLALVMGDQNRGDIQALLQLADFHLHGFTQLGVQRRQRLVEQQQLGMRSDGPRYCHALTLAARQFRHRTINHLLQLDQLQQLADPRLLLGLADAAQLERVSDVFTNGHVREQRQRLEHHAEIALMRRRMADVFTVQADFAAGQGFQPGDHAQQGGLAAARRAKKAHQFAFRQVQIDVGYRTRRAVVFLYVFQNQSGHFL